MIFFFKQKTAYEMRISDWSSDVCSSDLKALGQSQLSGAKDFTPIALYNMDPGAFYVAADSGFKDARDVVAKLKADPKKYKLASGSAIGGAWHMAFGDALLKADRKSTRLNSSH